MVEFEEKAHGLEKTDSEGTRRQRRSFIMSQLSSSSAFDQEQSLLRMTTVSAAPGMSQEQDHRARGPQCVSINQSTSYSSVDIYSPPTRREVWAFRAKYLLSSALSGFPRHWKSRVPKGKAVWLILFVGFLERIAYFGVTGTVLPPVLAITHLPAAVQAFLQAFILNVIAELFYPIAGWLADVWLGRYRTVHISLWLLWIGYSVLAITVAVPAWHYLHISLLPVLFVIISVGTAGFQANIIPIGADELTVSNANSGQLSSYFSWYYWLRNVAAISLLFSFTCTADPIVSRATCSYSEPVPIRITVFVCIGSICITVALVLWVVLKDWLFIDKERRNPWKTVGMVLHCVMTTKRPTERSAFSYGGMSIPSKFDLAKKSQGGKFENEQVEDVKTFLQLLLVLVTIGGAFMVYTGLMSTFSLLINHMNNSFLQLDGLGITKCVTSRNGSTSHWVVNIFTIILVIPILDQFIYPLLREYTPSLLKRIGLGYIFSFITPILLIIYEHVSHHGIPTELADQCVFVDTNVDSLPFSAYLVLIPFFTINLSEIFINISCLEFFYAQSPHSMRGMMIGLFYFMEGVFGTIAAFILFIFSIKDNVAPLKVSSSGESCGFWYYLVFFVVMVITIPIYFVVSWRYKNRQRGELEETEPYYRR